MIDYDSLFEKIPRVKKILDDGKNSILYHYTKPEKLLSILESGTIRFSNALYLNDKEEVTYSYKLICTLADEMPDLNQSLLKKIKEHFYTKYTNIINGSNDFGYKYEYYTISFSTEADNLTLWNNYAKGQKYTGYNIGFCKKDLLADMAKIQAILPKPKTNITIEYWNDTAMKYQSGQAYIPDISYEPYMVYRDINDILYKETRVAFIEYGEIR